MELLSLCMSPHCVDWSCVGDPVGCESVIYCLYRFALISGAVWFVTGVSGVQVCFIYKVFEVFFAFDFGCVIAVIRSFWSIW